MRSCAHGNVAIGVSSVVTAVLFNFGDVAIAGKEFEIAESPPPCVPAPFGLCLLWLELVLCCTFLTKKTITKLLVKIN